ncbi:MAG: hypothetical protein Q9210_005577 [Variospora velana]
MDIIYTEALATIIAASGSNADAGLPGVGEKVSPNFPITDRPVEDSLLRSSKYSTRAWTCPNTDKSAGHAADQDPVFQSSRPGHISVGFYHASLGNSTANVYLTLLREYTGRHLAKDGDILYAFNALENSLCRKMGGTFLQGLPTVALNFFLLFRGAGRMLERRTAFPSWSWAGWKGQVTSVVKPETKRISDQSVAYWLNTCTWIVWFYRRRWQPPVPVRMDIATVLSRWRTCDFTVHGCPTGIDPSSREPTINLALSPYRRKTHLLQFWTLSINLTIFRTSADDGYDNQCPRGVLVDKHNRSCGEIRLDGDYLAGQQDRGRKVEIILLAGNGRERPDVQEENEGSATQQMHHSYWVMLVERDEDELVAERKGLGVITREALDSSLAPGPAWREIILA